MPEIIILLLPMLGMVYAGSGVGHELEYVGSDLLSSRCLLFKSLYKVKSFMDFLVEGQKIGRHEGALEVSSSPRVLATEFCYMVNKHRSHRHSIPPLTPKRQNP